VVQLLLLLDLVAQVTVVSPDDRSDGGRGALQTQPNADQAHPGAPRRSVEAAARHTPDTRRAHSSWPGAGRAEGGGDSRLRIQAYVKVLKASPFARCVRGAVPVRAIAIARPASRSLVVNVGARLHQRTSSLRHAAPPAPVPARRPDTEHRRAQSQGVTLPESFQTEEVEAAPVGERARSRAAASRSVTLTGPRRRRRRRRRGRVPQGRRCAGGGREASHGARHMYSAVARCSAS
jgi:hypothetical protein